jgi:hypothetical protein
MKDRKAKQGLSWRGYQWKRVKEGEYGQYILYICMKIEP